MNSGYKLRLHCYLLYSSRDNLERMTCKSPAALLAPWLFIAILAVVEGHTEHGGAKAIDHSKINSHQINSHGSPINSHGGPINSHVIHANDNDIAFAKAHLSKAKAEDINTLKNQNNTINHDNADVEIQDITANADDLECLVYGECIAGTLITSVQTRSSEDCRWWCRSYADLGCTVYTYYANLNVCDLYSSCEDVNGAFCAMNGCVTGLADCQVLPGISISYALDL